MAYKLEEIEGIGPAYAAILREKAGLKSTEQLLDAAATKRGRQDLATMTGIDEDLLLRWVNMADLFRLRGVAEEFSDLMEQAGVDSVKELRTRNPQNLYAKIVEVNEGMRIAKRNPSLGEVEKWIEQANSLDPKITH